MNKILDFYFKRPLFWDYIISILLFFIINYILNHFSLQIPVTEQLVTIITDLSNISLTSAGFILTLLTLLITFKSSNKLDINDATYKDSRFDIFFASHLYFETVKHLKNCVISLIIISILGYTLKFTLNQINDNVLFFFSVLCLTLLVMTLWRCLLILTKILELQKNSNSE